MPSPDGKYAASEFIDYSAQTVDIILFGLGDQRPARLTFVNYWAGCPIWSPDSHRLLFTQWRDYLDVVPITGGTADKVPFPGGTNSDFPLSWAPNGQDLLFLRNTQATRTDMWILPMSGDHKPHPYLNAPVNESEGRISPDGRWVAYTTDESGRNEVFVQSFPVPGNKRRVSAAGGSSPMWQSDGRELFFITEDHALMAARITSSPNSLEFSTPIRLFANQAISPNPQQIGRPTYASSPDGLRFLVLVPVQNDRPEGLHYIRNWKP
jgi:Tol biopolymer transport system component